MEAYGSKQIDALCLHVKGTIWGQFVSSQEVLGSIGENKNTCFFLGGGCAFPVGKPNFRLFGDQI